MFFSYDPLDGVVKFHESADEAETECHDIVDFHRETAADDGWDESSGEVCWGEIRQRLTETSRRPVDPNTDFVSPSEFDEIVEMELLPKLGSDPEPEVDRLVREAEQRGRDAAVEVFARRVPELRNQILADAVREVEAAVAEAEQRGRDQERERCSLARSQLNWEFCEKWYDADQIYHSLNRSLGKVSDMEFAEWLALQYRLAMNKGMELVFRSIERGEQPGEGGDA